MRRWLDRWRFNICWKSMTTYLASSRSRGKLWRRWSYRIDFLTQTLKKNAVISPVNLFIGEMNYQLLYKKFTPTHLVTVSCFGIMRIQNEPIFTDCYSILLLKRRKNALFSQFLPNFRQVEPSWAKFSKVYPSLAKFSQV